MGEEALKGHALEMGFITLLPSFQLQFVSFQFFLPLSDEAHVKMSKLVKKARIRTDVPVLPYSFNSLH